MVETCGDGGDEWFIFRSQSSQRFETANHVVLPDRKQLILHDRNALDVLRH